MLHCFPSWTVVFHAERDDFESWAFCSPVIGWQPLRRRFPCRRRWRLRNREWRFNGASPRRRRSRATSLLSHSRQIIVVRIFTCFTRTIILITPVLAPPMLIIVVPPRSHTQNVCNVQRDTCCLADKRVGGSSKTTPLIGSNPRVHTSVMQSVA